ncbi:hypothetical protein D9M73_292820 [compost metagenome]
MPCFNAEPCAELMHAIVGMSGHLIQQLLTPRDGPSGIGDKASAPVVGLQQVQLRFALLCHCFCRLEDPGIELLHGGVILGQVHRCKYPGR